MIKQLSNKISFQLAKLTVMVAVLLGIVISLGQLFIDLKDEKKRLDDTMQQVLNISGESAIQAAINLDKELAEQAKGLFQFPPIYKAELVDNFGDTLASIERNRPADTRSWQWLMNLILKPSKSYSVELVHPDSYKIMGVMTVEVDIHSFTQNFFSRAFVVVLSGMLRNFLLASILFILFHYILTKPLMNIISAFAGITPGDKNNTAINISNMHRDDELGVLVHTINNLLGKFSESLERHRSAEEKIKKSEDQIKSSLTEKEILLREIHHRVKNNMQVISSLLNLQCGHIDDKKYVDIFIDSQNRIKSMSLVHEKLYQSEELANIDFNDYIRTLAQSLFACYEKAGSSIVLNIDTEDVVLTINTAIPCGLIINELLSNCLKHAFPDHENGEIDISFKKSSVDGEALYTMSVSDNGVGIPEGLDIRNCKSLGIQLITTLVEHQLQGEWELLRRDGTTYIIRFKELKFNKRI